MPQTETKIIFTIKNSVGSKKPRTFNDKKTLVDFINKEVSFWEGINIRSVTNVLSSLETIKDNINHLSDGDLSSKLSSINEFIPSSSPEAKFINYIYTNFFDVVDIDWDLLIVLLLGFPDRAHNNTSRSTTSRSLFSIFKTKELVSKSLTNKKETEIGKNIDKIFLEANGKINSTQNEFEQWKKEESGKQKTCIDSFNEEISELKKALNKEREAYNDDLTKLKTTYEESIKMKAPVEYWASLQSKSSKAGFFYLVGLIITCCVSAMVVKNIFMNFPKWLTQTTILSLTGIRGLFLLVTIISFLGFIIHILAKLMMNSFHMSQDARERVALTNVYLSLINESAITESEDRKLILQSLFSRSNTGLLGVNTSPTMPGMLKNIIEK